MKDKQLFFGYFFDLVKFYDDYQFEGSIGELDFYFARESSDWYISIYSNEAKASLLQQIFAGETMKECMDFCVKEAGLNLLEFKKIIDNF